MAKRTITFTIGTNEIFKGKVIAETENHITVQTANSVIFRIHRNWVIR